MALIALPPEYAPEGAELPNEAPDNRAERELRMRCIHAAIDIHTPGSITASDVIQEAAEILAFLNGSAK